MFIKVRICSRYSQGFYKFSTKNQKIITKLLKRTPIDNDFIVTRILKKYSHNKFKETYLDFSVRWEKFRIIKGNKMGKHNWEYNYEDKTYRIQSLDELNGEDKFYYLNRQPNIDVYFKMGKWKQIDENDFCFVWSKYTRKLHSLREK